MSEMTPVLMSQLAAQRIIAGQAESMSDHLLKLMLTIQRDRPKDLGYEPREALVDIHQAVSEHFLLISHAVDKDDAGVWPQVEVENDRLKDLIAAHEDDVPAESSTEAQIFFHDALALYRALLGNVKNMAEALAGKKWSKNGGTSR